MTDEQFERLVGELEEVARKNPSGYRTRVGLLAGLGYAYIVLVLAALIALLAVTGWALTLPGSRVLIFKFGWAVLLLIAVILRAMWITFPKPEGIEVTAAEAPALFAMVEEVRKALEAPKFDHVLLTDDFNAAVSQVPRLGIFGWPENYLLLGLPLLQLLPADEARAVVAHEMGHLSGNHGKFGARIYQVHQTWRQLLGILAAQGHAAQAVFAWFFRWYVPYFAAYSFVLRRSHEWDADRCAAELSGAGTAGASLLRIHLAASLLTEKYWPAVYEQVEQAPTPPGDVFSRLPRAAREGVPSEMAVQWLRTGLEAKSDTTDEHPALADRLRALGYESGALDPEGLLRERPDLAAPPSPSAAEAYLGAAAERYAAEMDRLWREGMTESWRQRHEYVQQSQTGLAELEAKAAGGDLTEEELWDRARWTAEFKGPKEAIPHFRELLARNPEHARGHYVLGHLLLSEQDDAGLAHLDAAMERESQSILSACEIAHNYLKAKGQTQEAARYRERAQQHAEKLERAAKERSTLTAKDTLHPPTLPEEELQPLREMLAKVQKIGAAYLVRKEVELFPERPAHVLALDPGVKWYHLSSDDQGRQIGEELDRLGNEYGGELPIPTDTFLILLVGEHAGLKKKVAAVPGAEIYRRPEK